MNIVEIENKIVEDLKTITTPEELKALQVWAKKAKKTKVIEPTVTSFKQMNYWYETPVRSQGSGKFLYRKSNNVSYTSFVFLGIEIKLPQSDVKYLFGDESFHSRQIWVDRNIKYGGWEYFPKQPTKELFGINFEQIFFDYLSEKKFFVAKKNDKTFYLCNSERNAIKSIIGKRLTQFDLCNSPVVKISKEQAEYLELYTRDWDSFFNNSDDSVSFFFSKRS